jgi:hypothetical protein
MLLSSLLATQLKKRSSEEEKLKKLSDSIKQKSKLVDDLNSSKALKPKKITHRKLYKIITEFRGGTDQLSDIISENGILFKFANKIAAFWQVLYHSLILKESKTKNIILKIVLFHAKSLVKFMLFLGNVRIDAKSGEYIISTTLYYGGLGAIVGWYATVVLSMSPLVVIAIIATRSGHQQKAFDMAYEAFIQAYQERLKELKDKIYVSNLPAEKPNMIEMKPISPDSSVDFSELSKSETIVPDLEFKNLESSSSLQTLGEEQTQSKIIQRIKKIRTNKLPHLRKGKTKYFKDFLKDIGENSIEMEVQKNPLPIRIKDEL